jgi:hypothetical protein
VDLVYYSAAIALAVLVFFASGSERKRTDLSASISQSSQELNRNLAIADAQLARYAALQRVISDPQPFHIWLDKSASEALDAKEVKEMALPCGCADHPHWAGACGPMSVNRTEYTAIDESIARAAHDYCNELRRQRAERISKDQTRNGPRNLAEIAHLIAYLQIETSLDVDGAKVTAQEIISWLVDANHDAEGERQRIRTNLEQVTGEYYKLETSIRKNNVAIAEIAISSKSGISLLASEIKEHYWPFVLISLLGLKIARVNYFDLLSSSAPKRQTPRSARREVC